jgi:Castor and Pollux, part of voltage-gated ion channel
MSKEGGRPRREPETPPLRHRLRYRFDNLLARGTSATLISLAAVTAAAVLVSSLLLTIAGVTLAGSEHDNWLEDLWQSLLRVMDPGTMAADVGWGRRLLALLVTVFGLLVAGTLIGIIAAGVEDRIDRMRRGRSVVIESDHVVVLGASDRLPVLLQQLALAAQSGGSRAIVVLADRDPAEMYEVLRRSRVRHVHSPATKLVFRSGDPTVPADLALVRLTTARAVVVLSDQRSDVAAVQTVLAMAAEVGGLHDVVVVVELLEESTAERLRHAYGASIHPIVTSDAVARTTAFALRQRGLSQVVEDLLDFQGCDLHVVARPDLAGSTFGDLVGGLSNARPIGLMTGDGTVALCPPFDTVVRPDDRVVMVAHNPDDVELSHGDRVVDDVGRPPPDVRPVEEHVVVLGWNERGANLLAGWASSTAASSAVDVIVDPEQVDPSSIAVPDLGPIPIALSVNGNAIGTVADLDPTTVVLLAPPGDDDDAADVRTMLDLEMLRRTLARREATPRFVVELRDATHAALVGLAGPDDLVVSDAMGSQFIAQLVDQPQRRDVLRALYAGDGATLRLTPCEQFDLVGEWSARDVVARAASFGVLAIGWRHVGAGGGELTLNPHLTTRVSMEPGDEIVVVGRTGGPASR